ncbi:MAG TPA: hypothetical protein VLA99_06660 [Nitrospiraceae bacterium]|nr:hypothetical protein [Nitrospiraceae bacterium]
MSRSSFTQIAETTFSSRLLADGELADQPGGRFRVDATAWGILALQASRTRLELLEPLRSRLVQEQGADGRVWMDRDHPDAYWPTPLAILAWRDSPANRLAQSRAMHFLLETTGVHYHRRPDDPLAHNTFLKGWPWVAGTHSWIEPTALSVVALQATGLGRHDRVREAVLMMLDRQLPHGGWNYGNTLVFGQELHPMPESTGAALTGLAGQVSQDRVALSLKYLQGVMGQIRTPLSLGWALLGLAAWGQTPANSTALVERCLANQSRYDPYDTSALSLLFLAASGGGLVIHDRSS